MQSSLILTLISLQTVLPISPSITSSISVRLSNLAATYGVSSTEPAAVLLQLWLLLLLYRRLINGLCVWLWLLVVHIGLIHLGYLVWMRVILRLLVGRTLRLSVVVRVLVEASLRSSYNSTSSTANRLTGTLEGLEGKTAAILLVGIILSWRSIWVIDLRVACVTMP